MAKSWMNTLKGYFTVLNQLEVEGDIQDLESFHRGSADGKKEMERIQRSRDHSRYRNAKPIKCKTIIKNIKILSEDKRQIELLLHNYMWKLYHIDHHYMEQEDEFYHQITLREQSGDWYIASDTVVGKEQFQTGRLPDSMTDDEEPLAGESTQQGQTRAYNRVKVKRYAELWWNRYNPGYPKFEVDCTNFVSQCLHEGGIPMEHTGQRNKGWWVNGKSNWSFSWSVAHSLMNYLLGENTNLPPKAESKSTADELMIGDVICYDWDGNGNYQHNTIVVAKDPNGMPLVNAHTTNSRHRYWDYQDSYAWTNKTQYKFIHMKD